MRIEEQSFAQSKLSHRNAAMKNANDKIDANKLFW
jgi:hypothetical protein